MEHTRESERGKERGRVLLGVSVDSRGRIVVTRFKAVNTARTSSFVPEHHRENRVAH